MTLEFEYRSTLQGPWPDHLEVWAMVVDDTIISIKISDPGTNKDWTQEISKSDDASEIESIFQAIYERADLTTPE